MKRAFTLIELLVVIVVIAILMSISFGLLNVGEDDEKRRKTIVKIQKLENAVSGYYAAFGSYPPVPVTGSRNIFHKVTKWGSQQIDGVDAEPAYGELKSDRVEAACRSQMMGAAWPWGNAADAAKVRQSFAAAKKVHDRGNSEAGHEKAGLGAEPLEDVQRVNKFALTESSWSYVQIFRFGLISFLLPRYLVMLNVNEQLAENLDNVLQWTGCNTEIPCKFDDGVPYGSWSVVAKKVRKVDASREYMRPDEAREIALLPSQIVTTRWLPNLEKSLLVLNPRLKEFVFYGVDLRSPEQEDQSPYTIKSIASLSNLDGDMFFPMYSSNNNQNGEDVEYVNAYVLDGVTMVDAYNRELYYYSPPPYQSYCIWSSGKNQMTFPPWMSEKEIDALGSDNAQKARRWKADDIMHMSN